MFKPQYRLTDKIVNMLTAIAEAREVIKRAKLLPKQEIRLRRQALIRMTHSSTEIEGNILNLQQVEAVLQHKKIDAPARDIYEVKNYLKALAYISKVVAERNPINEKIILKIHQLVTDKTLSREQSGYYRKRPVYVVRREAGTPQEIVYTAPNAQDVPQLMKDFAAWLRASQKRKIHPIIVAGIAHAEIAAIHPFADGNGRTARAVATLILYQRGYDFRRLFALEDYYNRERSKYYAAINMGKNYEERRTDLTKWLEYFIKGFEEEIDDVRTKIVALSRQRIDEKISSQIYLDDSQVKILDFLDQTGRITVKDAMDILECPKRSAQFHLQRLKKIKMIVQVGKGPSSAYVVAR